jgi:hypothetical protein
MQGAPENYWMPSNCAGVVGTGLIHFNPDQPSLPQELDGLACGRFAMECDQRQQCTAAMADDEHKQFEDSSESQGERLDATSMANEVLQQLNAGPDEQNAAIDQFSRLAFHDKVSCRAAQLALEHASSADAALLASCLELLSWSESSMDSHIQRPDIALAVAFSVVS